MAKKKSKKGGKSKKAGKPKKIKINNSATKKDIKKIDSKIKNVDSKIDTLIVNSNIIKTLETQITNLFSGINVNKIGWTIEPFTHDNISYDKDYIPNPNPNQHPSGLNPPVSITGGLIKQNQAHKNL